MIADHKQRGALLLYMDKGYKRSRDPDALPTEKISEWWRIVVNDVHPTAYFQKVPRAYDRAKVAGLKLHGRQSGGSHIMIAGSSAKFHLAAGLPPPAEWVAGVIAGIRERTDRPIIYRPKPSYHDAVPVEGAEFDWGNKTQLRDILKRCAVMVTHGSIASVDSICAGVPAIILGNAVAKPISSTSLEEIQMPKWASDEDRRQWASDLAYCQWRVEEFMSGLAWRVIREQIEIERSCRR